MEELTFFELKEEDQQEMNTYYTKQDIPDLSKFYDKKAQGRVFMIYYYYDYIKKNFPDIFRDLGIDYIEGNSRKIMIPR